MNVGQPSKIGTIGYLMALMAQLFWILPIIDLANHPLDIWHVFSIVFLTLAIVSGYILARKDAYIKHLGWRLAFWHPDKGRAGFAYAFIMYGSLWLMLTITIVRSSGSLFTLEGWYEALSIGAFILLLSGWVLILTEREDPPPAQEHRDDTT
jgi:hypothetical protein